MGTRMGQAPSFSFSVILERKKEGKIIHTKELHFAVSLLGNFIQIHGFDSTVILDQKNQKGYSAINVVTTSPFEEFKESFEYIENKLNSRYPNHRLVPFAIGQGIINGLQVNHRDEEICSVSSALFG